MIFTGSDREEKSGSVRDGALGVRSSSKAHVEEHDSRAADADNPGQAATADGMQNAALQQQGQLLVLLAGFLLIGLVMLLPELASYLSNLQSRITRASVLM